MMPVQSSLRVVTERAARGHEDACARWARVVGPRRLDDFDVWAGRFAQLGRVTLNLHPDRVADSDRTVAAGLLGEGRYRSQWVTGISNGSRSAVQDGDRHRFERSLFDGAYDDADPRQVEFPVYGAFDLLRDPHGGSPRFGSSFVVLHPHVLARTTMCVGDSHVGPRDVGTAEAPWCLMAGLAEQAATGMLLGRPLGVDDMLAVFDGHHRSERPGRSLDGYIEAQVHGGIDLAVDVEAIVLDPSYTSTSVARDVAAAAERYGFTQRWHDGSELEVGDVPTDFRGPTMPQIARQVARTDGMVDAERIGRAARRLSVGSPLLRGDPPGSAVQQLKYLWHTVLARGHDAASAPG